MFFLKLRMWLMLTVLFGLIYAVIVMAGRFFFNVTDFSFYLMVSLFIMLVQYLVGPKIVEWSMKVRYVTPSEYPQLHQMVEELSMKAGIPKPRVGVSEINIPNAFAFGRSRKDGRICVTKGIIQLIDKQELRAVLGHEISHLKNRDVLTITLLSIIPIILYRVAWHLIFYGGRGRRERSGNTVLIGFAALVFYFITNLLVLYASRIREYFADRGSVLLGNPPSTLASALYKLVYGSARLDKNSLKEVEGLKAFFVNDPSCALRELSELRQLDLDKSGSIDSNELTLLGNKKVFLTLSDKLLELQSTHPNMLKRIKQLSKYRPD